jgi:hypothetical protein
MKKYKLCFKIDMNRYNYPITISINNECYIEYPTIITPARQMEKCYGDFNQMLKERGLLS